MGVDLICPNCGATVGYASHEDDYKEKYLCEGENGQPICSNCRAGEYPNAMRNFLFIILALIAIIVCLGIYFKA